MGSAILIGTMLLVGCGVGLLSNALGVGGGIIMVPAFLEFLPGMDAHTAKGTSLLVVAFVASVNTWHLNRRRQDRPWHLAFTLSSGAVIGAYSGGWLTQFMSSRVVLGIFAAFTAVAGIRTLSLKDPVVTPESVRRRRLVAFFIGFLAGFVSGMTGIGGGIVLVPLVLVASLVTNDRVVALSNIVMIPTSLAAVLAHVLAPTACELPWTLGQVNLAVAPLVFLGAQVSGPWGRRLNQQLTLPRRRVVMGSLLFLIAARLFFRTLWQP